jgi:hypothetical protein
MLRRSSHACRLSTRAAALRYWRTKHALCPPAPRSTTRSGRVATGYSTSRSSTPVRCRMTTACGARSTRNNP